MGTDAHDATTAAHRLESGLVRLARRAQVPYPNGAGEFTIYHLPFTIYHPSHESSHNYKAWRR
jgi:hypothetical protein